MPPVRKIVGPATQLNWPTGLFMDLDSAASCMSPTTAEVGSGVQATAEGNAAPIRVIKGPRTKLVYPTFVFVDRRMTSGWPTWAAIARRCSADRAGTRRHLREIRSAPEGRRRRRWRTCASARLETDQISHPIEWPIRRLRCSPGWRTATLDGGRIEATAAKLSRTMHSIFFDQIHDEIVVTNPFAQAVLTFRGDANGEVPPIRIIQGPKTGLSSRRDER